jgi:hypothetical protein
MNTLRELANLYEPKKGAGREREKITVRETSQFASQHKILSVVKLWTCSTHVETAYTPTQAEEIEHIYEASTHRKF